MTPNFLDVSWFCHMLPWFPIEVAINLRPNSQAGGHHGRRWRHQEHGGFEGRGLAHLGRRGQVPMGKCSDGCFGEADFHGFFMVFLSFPSVLPWLSMVFQEFGFVQKWISDIFPHHGKFWEKWWSTPWDLGYPKPYLMRPRECFLRIHSSEKLKNHPISWRGSGPFLSMQAQYISLRSLFYCMLV